MLENNRRCKLICRVQFTKKMNLFVWAFGDLVFFQTAVMFEFLCKQLEAAVLKNGDIFLEKRLLTWKSKHIVNRIINTSSLRFSLTFITDF